MNIFNKTALSALTILASTAAYAGGPKTDTELLLQVHDLAMECGVQSVSFDGQGQKKLVGKVRSVCPELLVSDSHARFKLKGKTYYARIVESDQSDGGDLDDLVISNRYGVVVAKLSNILSFGDILVALAGGDNHFREEQNSGFDSSSQ